jgi:hypothetical protein
LSGSDAVRLVALERRVESLEAMVAELCRRENARPAPWAKPVPEAPQAPRPHGK